MTHTAAGDRLISLGVGLPEVPERLLLAHAMGRVLFIAGAGISMPSLPSFKGLTLDVYSRLDPPLHKALEKAPSCDCQRRKWDLSGLTARQCAEARRFAAREYDVALGMLERRIDSARSDVRIMRQEVADSIRRRQAVPTALHRALMNLSNRGAATAIVTTNFDLLLEESLPKLKLTTHALGAMPRPSSAKDFNGVFHIHGALSRDGKGSDFILTDQDFGDYYMRRRGVSDFIYDAARLFHLVIVGYSASDPPMRYLLSAVAADTEKFVDLKEIYAFVGSDKFDPVSMEEWIGRGITPIHYDDKNDHSILREVLSRWSDLSAINGDKGLADTAILAATRSARPVAEQADVDIVEHLFRRASNLERARMAKLLSDAGRHPSWLGVLTDIALEARMTL